MRITTEHVGRLLEARLERTQRAGSAPRLAREAGVSADRASFSSRAEDLRLGLAAARASQTSEDSRTRALAQQVRSGRYRIPAGAVAEAFLRDLRGS